MKASVYILNPFRKQNCRQRNAKFPASKHRDKSKCERNLYSVTLIKNWHSILLTDHLPSQQSCARNGVNGLLRIFHKQTSCFQILSIAAGVWHQPASLSLTETHRTQYLHKLNKNHEVFTTNPYCKSSQGLIPQRSASSTIYDTIQCGGS